ncbi:MAG: hypothetical protein J5970_01780 [Bacilli bacterium]|nr:hypothetical protein [Bacilli bacterium]
MIKNFLESLKLSKLSYLLEVIELRDFKNKIVALNKIQKMKITKEMGSIILDAAEKDHKNNLPDFDIKLSLLSLLFKNYYSEYSDRIKKIYPTLEKSSKYDLLLLLANSNNDDAIILYKELVLKYGKELDDIPIGSLSTKKSNYDLLFPDILKALKYDIKRNNILLLLNDYVVSNVAREKDVKKYKKDICNNINTLLKQAVNFKFKKNENVMQNADYLNLRIYLEAAIDLEFYVSNKDTKANLEKLLKKKDNQIKLFVLENYIKKGKDISKINLNTIAKDLLSRYPLFSFLKFYNLERLMPKKYANNLALSESDLYINFCVDNKYTNLPLNMEFVEDRLVNNYRYYVYKFETKFNYSEEIKDIATDYILKNTSIDKEMIKNGKVNYIGISGGYNKDVNPSIIEKGFLNLPVKKYFGDYTKVIDELMPKKDVPLKVNFDKVKEKLPKKKEKISIFKKKEKVPKEKKEKKLKIVKEEKPVVELPSVDAVLEDEYKEPSLLRKIFSFNTLLFLVCLCLIGSFLVLFSYLSGMDILDLKKHSITHTILNINNPVEVKGEEYKEIKYEDIFKQPQKEYYVLFYNKKKKSIYHNMINTLTKNKYIIYYVDTKKDENKPIFGGNPTGFVISDDTLLKVNDGEYEFYVVKKTNIVKELRDYVNEIDKKIEEEKKKQEIEKKKEEVNKRVQGFINPNKVKKAVSKIEYLKKRTVAISGKKLYNLSINVEKEE